MIGMLLNADPALANARRDRSPGARLALLQAAEFGQIAAAKCLLDCALELACFVRRQLGIERGLVELSASPELGKNIERTLDAGRAAWPRICGGTGLCLRPARPHRVHYCYG